MKAINAEEFAQICFDIAKDQKGQGNYANALFVSELGKMISTYPTVDAAPIKHGQWIHLDQEESTISGKCSCCGWEAHYYEDDVADMPYCPNCGARMDLEEQDAKEET